MRDKNVFSSRERTEDAEYMKKTDFIKKRIGKYPHTSRFETVKNRP